MKKIIILVVVLTATILAQDFDYIGTMGCKMCHKKEEKGAQFSKWEASVHASAFETLKTDQATKIIQEKGITTNAWETPECIKCHTTGFGDGGYEIMDEAFWSPAADDRTAAKAVKRMSGLQSVGCEACHGPGSEYKSKKKMEAIFNGEIDGTTLGLINPGETTCKGCHNKNSPTFKSFIFDEYWEKIAHPIP